VLGILHLVVGALTVPWLLVQILVLVAVLGAEAVTVGGAPPDTTRLALLVALTGVGLLAQVAGGVGLLKGTRWGRQLSWLYAGLAIAAGLLLWLAGGRVLLATLWLLYPVLVAALLATGDGSR